jgi:tetraacyldisaccharide 4'-kinase
MVYIPKEMKPAFLVFSFFSRSVSRVKNFLYDRRALRPRRAPVPVISVGNLSLGGTEKTPLAMELLAQLIASGRRPALVSRGYKGRWEKTGGVVSDGRTVFGTWEDAGDEPYLAARTVPRAGVYVGKDRLSSCRRAAAAGFDIVVLDDGFQHRRLARDLDILLFSPDEKVAWREPLSSYRRSDILLVKAGEEESPWVEKWRQSYSGAFFTYSVVIRGITDLGSGERGPVEHLAHKKLLAFCGIARPKRFEETLRRAGLTVVSFLPFPDHHPYRTGSLDRIYRAFRETQAEALITTAKDAIKIANRMAGLGGAPAYVLEIGLDVEPGFNDRWLAILTKGRTA